jgi:hypothetical protein
MVVSPSIRVSRTGSLVAIVLLGTLAPPPVEAQWSTARDSAGVSIIENRSPNPDAAPLRLGPEPVVTIGGPDGDAGTDFTVILSGRLLPQGLIAVVDLRIPEIRIFDAASGELVRSIGRGGEGPGEFGAAPTIAVTDGGDLWAWDPGNRRVSRFDLDGGLIEEHRLGPSLLEGVPLSFTPTAWDVSRSGVVLSLREAPRSPGVNEYRIRLLDRANRSPVLIGDRHTTRHVGDGQYFLGDPFTFPLTGTIVGDEVIVVRPGSWEVTAYDPRGRLVRRIRSGIPRTHIDRAVIATERRFLEETYPETPVFLRLFDRLSPGDSTAAIGGVLAPREGGLWVQRWRLRGQETERIYDLMDPEGRWERTIRVPGEAGEVLDVSGTRVLTVFYDELLVPYVRVYRLEG